MQIATGPDGEAAGAGTNLGEVRRATHLKRLHICVRVELCLRWGLLIGRAVERGRGRGAIAGLIARED